MAVFAALAASCSLVVARIGAHVINGSRAQSVADSVALAWVLQGRTLAIRVADGLNARIVSSLDDGSVVNVSVLLSGAQRSATAMRAVTDHAANGG